MDTVASTIFFARTLDVTLETIWVIFITRGIELLHNQIIPKDFYLNVVRCILSKHKNK
jgi:hypothetical protein